MSGKPSKLKFKGSKKRTTVQEEGNGSRKRPAVEDAGSSLTHSISETNSSQHTVGPTVERDDWMLESKFTSVPKSEDTGRFTKAAAQDVESAQPQQAAKEKSEDVHVSAVLKDEYEVPYTFGDAGSSWRMMKLQKLYRTAQEMNRPPELVALERYGSLLNFDIAREEEKELNDRKHAGHQLKSKPTGYFYHQRKFVEDEDTEKEKASAVEKPDLNQLRAKVLKAKLQKSHDYEALQAKYDELSKEEVVQSSGKSTEVQKKGEELQMGGDYKSMVRESVRSILKDKKFSVDLDEQDEKLSSFAENINSGKLKFSDDLQGLQRLNDSLGRCQLCLDNNRPVPIVEKTQHFVISLAPHQALVKNSLMIFPLKHRRNSLQLESAEKVELRKIMIKLTRFFSRAENKRVLFYETSKNPLAHCSILAVPLARSIGEDLIFDYFKNGLIEHSNDLDQQHKIVIDTRNRAYDVLISPAAPFFHAWVNLDGGIGHVIEDDEWPPGDLFARRIIGGILKIDKFDIEKRTKLYAGNGVTDQLLQDFKKLYATHQDSKAE